LKLTSIGSGIAVSVQTQNGLGRDIVSLSEAQIVAYEKVLLYSFHAALGQGSGRCICGSAYPLLHCTYHVQGEYANKLLYIATLALAKLSIISLLMMIKASDLHRNIGVGLTVFITTWGVVSICVGALQCGTDKPWKFIGGIGSCTSLVSILSPTTMISQTKAGGRPASGAASL
jgi:hypothetical protein